MFDDKSLKQNFKEGVKATCQYPEKLFDRYNKDQKIQSIMRQLFFYHFVFFSGIAMLNYLNDSIFQNHNKELEEVDQSLYYQVAEVLSNLLVSTVTYTVIYGFPLTYGLAFEENYSNCASLNNIKKQKILSCHEMSGHDSLILQSPIVFFLGKTHFFMLSQLPYCSIPARIGKSMVQMMAFEYYKAVNHFECRINAIESLEKKTGFLLGQALVYALLNQIVNASIPSPFNTMISLLIYHGFSISTAFSDRNTPEDNFHFNLMKSSKYLLENIEKMISFYSKSNNSPLLPFSLNKSVCDAIMPLKHLLPVKPKWYNLPFHQLLGIYKSMIEGKLTENSTKLAVASKAQSCYIPSAVHYLVKSAECFYFIKEDQSRNYLLNNIDYTALANLVDSVKDTIKTHQNYTGKHPLISYLQAANRFDNTVHTTRYEEIPMIFSDYHQQQEHQQQQQTCG